MTDANGHVTTYGGTAASDFGYDLTGYPKTFKDVLNNVTTYTYDERGKLIEVKVPHKMGVDQITRFE